MSDIQFFVNLLELVWADTTLTLKLRRARLGNMDSNATFWIFPIELVLLETFLQLICKLLN